MGRPGLLPSLSRLEASRPLLPGLTCYIFEVGSLPPLVRPPLPFPWDRRLEFNCLPFPAETAAFSRPILLRNESPRLFFLLLASFYVVPRSLGRRVIPGEVTLEYQVVSKARHIPLRPLKAFFLSCISIYSLFPFEVSPTDYFFPFSIRMRSVPRSGKIPLQLFLSSSAAWEQGAFPFRDRPTSCRGDLLKRSRSSSFFAPGSAFPFPFEDSWALLHHHAPPPLHLEWVPLPPDSPFPLVLTSPKVVSSPVFLKVSPSSCCVPFSFLQSSCANCPWIPFVPRQGEVVIGSLPFLKGTTPAF